MKRVLFSFVLLLIIFSCKNKKNDYSKELQKIFDRHGGVESFKNIKSISFVVGTKTFTTDLVSGKRVINAPDYSLGFDGKNYWISDKCPIQNPEKYIKKFFNTFLIPFLMTDIQQTESDEDSAVLHFNETKVFYNSEFFMVDSVKFLNNKVLYKKWQEIVGFTLPKKVVINKNLIEFKNVSLSQAVFDDRFYQKPN